MALLETQWITVQQKTFMKWLNSKLEVRNLAITDLVKDLSDGVCLGDARNTTILLTNCALS